MSAQPAPYKGRAGRLRAKARRAPGTGIPAGGRPRGASPVCRARGGSRGAQGAGPPGRAGGVARAERGEPAPGTRRARGGPPSRKGTLALGSHGVCKLTHGSLPAAQLKPRPLSFASESLLGSSVVFKASGRQRERKGDCSFENGA